jgi:hypothetical protein
VTLRSRPPDAFSSGGTPPFEESAKTSLDDTQLRRNLGTATKTIREKRAVAVAEMPDWEELREAGRALKTRVMRHLDEYPKAGRSPSSQAPRRPRTSSSTGSRACTARAPSKCSSSAECPLSNVRVVC